MEFAFLPKKETVTKNKGAQSLTERVTASDIARALVTIFFLGGKICHTYGCVMLHYTDKRAVSQIYVPVYMYECAMSQICNTLHDTATHCNTLQHTV